MLSIPANISIFLHTEPTDMRKGFDGLPGIVREHFGADPTSGSLYLFINRRRDRLKILHFDGTGYWLYYKLSSSKFRVFPRFLVCRSVLAMLARWRWTTLKGRKNRENVAGALLS